MEDRRKLKNILDLLSLYIYIMKSTKQYTLICFDGLIMLYNLIFF
jgi:hypothetical protein